MIFDWFRNRRRKELLAEPFPKEWFGVLKKNVALYALLSETEKKKLRDDLRVLVAEKNWEGCGGLQMSDEIKVTIAALACLPLLNVGHDYFSRVHSILVYPSAYRKPRKRPDPDGFLPEEDDVVEGEAWVHGPIVVSWEGTLEDARDPGRGRNVVLHEFAHEIDFLDGDVDGTPPLSSREQYRTWREVMSAEYERHRRDSEAGRATLLDEYGAQDPVEFFAVATECFFARPVALRKRHPRLYEVLRDCYRQDTAARVEKAKGL